MHCVHVCDRQANGALRSAVMAYLEKKTQKIMDGDSDSSDEE